MLLCAGEREYKVIREVFTGEKNDVYICQNAKEPKAPFKTLWLVKDRILIRILMGSMGDVCEENFMQNENACFVFPYFVERPLFRFYLGTIRNGSCTQQQVLLELVVRCMTSGLPTEILNLILKQDQINIGADGMIWFGFSLDLSEYKDHVLEKENVSICAGIISELSGLERASGYDITMRLLDKKLNRGGYEEFIQLYKDIKLIVQEQESADTKEKLKGFVRSKQDSIYRFLACLCIVLVCTTIIFAIGHFVFGEFSFWKLFSSPLDMIGTESLLQ